MRILAIAGSLRAGSSNTALLEAAAAIAPPGMEVTLYCGLGGLPHFNPDLDLDGQASPPAVAELRRQVSGSAALIISSPEYAHGVPGALKNALDWLVSDEEFAGKPVLLLNASPAGGEHAQASLAETLRTMAARVVDAPRFLRGKPGGGRQLAEAEAQSLRALLEALAELARC